MRRSAPATVSPDFRDEAVERQAQLLEHNLPRQRIAVRVQAGGGQADQPIAGLNPAAVDEPRLVHHADDEPREIVFAGVVEPRHLRRLTANQRASVLAAGAPHPADDLRRHFRIEPARGQIVQEEHRLRAVHQDVVHAVIDEVGAHRVVDPGQERDLELRADAVGAGNQDGIGVVRRREPEHAAEGADFRQHARRERGARDVLDAADGVIARFDVDA